MPAIWKCFKYADLVKMTIEELDFVAGDVPHLETLGKIMAADVRLILITDGVTYYAISVPKIVVKWHLLK